MKRVLIILGPTGVGKSSAALLLAKKLGAEIISADSMQIYRLMDLGTAKPSVEEMNAVRHHMIDIVEPWESYSAGRYIAEVSRIIGGLHDRNILPLVVGGTGLYVKAMTRGIFEGPSADWNLRAELMDQEVDEPGILFRKLMTCDPKAAARIEPNDLRRVIRALEVCLKGGPAISQLQAEQTEKLPFDFVKIGVTRDRAELYSIINRRVDQMMEHGLLDEVKNVLSEIRSHHSGPVSEISALQAIGYKELIKHIEGGLSMDEAVELIKKGSRNYAKRQFTWFRKEEGIHWLDVTGIFDAEEIASRLAGLSKTHGAPDIIT
jgi:tRNA dimethylallyltransferase